MNKKIKIRYIVDIVTLISFLITAFTGLAIKLFMPSGARRTGLQEFLGYTRHTWVQTHDIAGIIMIIFALIHVILYWNTFVCMTKNFFKEEKLSESKEDEKCETKETEKPEEAKETETKPSEVEEEKVNNFNKE